MNTEPDQLDPPKIGPDLSIAEQLLMAQAVHNVRPIGALDQTMDWEKVTGVLRKYLKRTRNESSWKINLDDPVAFCNAYQDLYETYQKKEVGPSTIEPTLKIVRAIYEERIKRILGSLKEEENRYKDLCLEVEAINRGEWNNKLVEREETEKERNEVVEDKTLENVSPKPPGELPVRNGNDDQDDQIMDDGSNPADAPSQNLPSSVLKENPIDREKESAGKDKRKRTSSTARTRKRKARSSSTSQSQVDSIPKSEPGSLQNQSSAGDTSDQPQNEKANVDEPLESPTTVPAEVSVSGSAEDLEEQAVLEQLTGDRAPSSAKSKSTNESDDREATKPPESDSRETQVNLGDGDSHSADERKTTKSTATASESGGSPIQESNKPEKTDRNQSSEAESKSENSKIKCKEDGKRSDEVKEENDTGHQITAQSPNLTKKARLDLENAGEEAYAETPNSANFPTGVTEGSSTAQQTPISAEMVVPTPDQSASRSVGSAQSDPTSFRKKMLKTHSSVQSNPVSSVFRKPVKESDAPGYSVIVKRPMDLRTLARKLRDGEVNSAEEYRRDLMLMLANAVMFNHEDSQVSKNAKELMMDCDRLVSIFMRGSRY